MYVVLEIMKTGDLLSATPTIHQTKNEAKAKFFQLVGSAATSSVDRHHVSLINESGKVLMNDGFDHLEEEV